METKRIASIVTVAVALTAAVTALADNNFCAAAGCQVQSGTITYQSDGSVKNTGSGEANIICPIDRGNFGSTSKLQGAAFVSSTSPNLISCDINTVNAQTGTFFDNSQTNSGTGSRESLPFTSISHHGSFDYDYIHCLMDPGSVLYGYRGVEE